MKIKDLIKGMEFKSINGVVDGMVVSFDKGGQFECIWCTLNLINADIVILNPKKKFGQSGIYPWVKISKDYKVQLRGATEGEYRKDEYIIPWSNLKKCVNYSNKK